MAKDPDNLAAQFDSENTGGFLAGFLAEEEQLDRRALWRLGSWGVASVAAIVVAVLANQSSISFRRDQLAAADLSRQSQQLQAVAKAAQNETRRLASAVDTLNDDRDRLYSRVAVLEQGLDSVTGAIQRQSSAASSQPPPAATALPQPASPDNAPAPVVAPVATTPATSNEKPPVTAMKADPAPAPAAATVIAPAKPSIPEAAAAAKATTPEPKSTDVNPSEAIASTEIEEDADPVAAKATKTLVHRTQFGADVGGANSVDGLRALWRSLLRSSKSFEALRPIIVVKEAGNRSGMQLRLVVGPVDDAAAAAKICAALLENKRPCETTVFDGQRLALKSEETAPPAKPAPHRRSVAKGANEAPPKPETSTFSALFGKR